MKLIKPILFTFFVFLLLNAFPAIAQSNSVYPEYAVQSGDNLYSIASKFDTTVPDIIAVNGLLNPDLLSPGQLIKIPNLPGISGLLTSTVTNLGDSQQTFEKKYKIDSEKFVFINKITSPTQLIPGFEVIVPVNENDPGLVPIGEHEIGKPFIETSALINANPAQLLLMSQFDNETKVMPGTFLFGLQKSGIQFSSFAPNLSSITITPLPISQGSTVSIRIASKKPIELHGSLNGIELHFFPDEDGKFVALQGIDALAEPGLTSFEVHGTIDNDLPYKYEVNILLTPGNFDQDPPIIVDPSFIDPKITGPENELVQSIVSKISPIQHWTGTFQSPAYYQYVNSKFGTRRTYNDDPTITFHTGLDFGGGITLPIYAPAAGQVVFAGPLTIRGNTVFIDHGRGVFSGFFHQNSIKVKVGDVVTPGQVIGEVGNTGRVDSSGAFYGAGAHLHWEIWVNGIQVDPMDWLNQDFPR